MEQLCWFVDTQGKPGGEKADKQLQRDQSGPRLSRPVMGAMTTALCRMVVLPEDPLCPLLVPPSGIWCFAGSES